MFLKHGHAFRGGLTPEYRSWKRIIVRCENKNTKDFPDYGGRGIKVCDRWRHSFENFLADMGLKPSPRHSIDRIDNNGHYQPDNCRWATPKEQSRNARRNHLVTFQGQTLCVSELAEKTGIRYHTLRSRIRLGWTVERAISEPVHPRHSSP